MADLRTGEYARKLQICLSVLKRNKKLFASAVFLTFLVLVIMQSDSGRQEVVEIDQEDEFDEDTNKVSAEDLEREKRRVIQELEEALNKINMRKSEEKDASKGKNKATFDEIIQRGRKPPTRGSSSPPNACQKNSLKSGSRKDVGFISSHDGTVHVYSAYYNTRIPEDSAGFIKIVGMARPDVHMYCHVWYKVDKASKRELEIVEATLEHGHLPGQNMSMQSVVIKCKVPKHKYATWTPRWVVLSTSPCGPPSAVLPIKDPGKYITHSYDYTVCLQKPLTADDIDTQQFIEWVEMNRVLGAKHFTVYTSNASDIMMPYLHYYVDNGLMDYKEWNLGDVVPDIHSSKSRQALINDCIFHNIHSTEFLAILDVTTFPVSYKESSLVELLNSGHCDAKPGVKFASVFFPTSAPADQIFRSDPAISATELTVLSQTSRTQLRWPCDFLDQMVVKPEMVFNQNKPITDELVPDACCLPSTLGRLYHYREWDAKEYVAWNHDFDKRVKFTPANEDHAQRLVLDRRLHRYAGDLIQGVADAFRAVDPAQYVRFAQLADRGSWSL